MTGQPETHALVFDVKQWRPACVLLQAAYGCGTFSREFSLFDSRTWLTFPTDDMRMVSGTFEEWQAMAAAVNRSEGVAR